jgi:hypothetical protein
VVDIQGEYLAGLFNAVELQPEPADRLVVIRQKNRQLKLFTIDVFIGPHRIRLARRIICRNDTLQ